MPEANRDQKEALVRELLSVNPLNQAVIATALYAGNEQTAKSRFNSKLRGTENRRFTEEELDRILDYLRTEFAKLGDQLEGREMTPTAQALRLRDRINADVRAYGQLIADNPVLQTSETHAIIFLTETPEVTTTRWAGTFEHYVSMLHAAAHQNPAIRTAMKAAANLHVVPLKSILAPDAPQPDPLA